MAFVNEYASPEDVKKYDLEGIFQRFDKDILGKPSWTIDRERDAILIWLRNSREESRNYQMFAMWWKGAVFPVYLIPSGGGQYSKKSYTHWQLMELDISHELVAERAVIISALKDALTEYRAGGIGVPVVDHTVTFDF
jgi:hypothetical protein